MSALVHELNAQFVTSPNSRVIVFVNTRKIAREVSDYLADSASVHVPELVRTSGARSIISEAVEGLKGLTRRSMRR